MYFKKNKEYAIRQSVPHLVTDCEQSGTACLVDTGFNGSSEKIPGLETFAGAAGGKNVVWIGSKYLKNRGSCLDIDYDRGIFAIRDSCDTHTRAQNRVRFSSSASCSGLSFLGCPLGPIIAIPVRVNQGAKEYRANAFVDTGSGFSVVLRSLMHRNQFKTLDVEECTDTSGVERVTIDGQDLNFKPRNISLSIESTTGVVPTDATRMMIACGKRDRIASKTYNDKLGLVNLSPHVQVTVGNDALAGFSRVQVDYDKRVVYLGHRGVDTDQPIRQFQAPRIKPVPVVALAALVALWGTTKDKTLRIYGTVLILGLSLL